MFFESGVEAGDAHGFAQGGAITYQVHDASGRFIAQRTVTITPALAGGNWNALRLALGANNTGIGEFGDFALHPVTGRMSFTADPGFQVTMMSDSTQRGTTGVSFSALQGLSQTSTSGRAMEVNVNALISADPGGLAVGRPDISAVIGARVIEAGDNRGASALVAARDSVRSFAAAGVLTAQSTSLAIYAARLGGEAGRLASDAQRSAKGAEAVATAASDRRAQIEGVSLDDELLKMTTYQNAYAASARVIQAATDMLDILMAIGYR
jgi:flagellar hook-associated protein 1 FlgK